MIVLGIESTCDETAAAVVQDGSQILSNIIASQHELHRAFGGVVPEVAARAHAERITAIIDEALKAANLAPSAIDAISVANRPGLVGALLVGVSAAKGLALTWDIPFVGIDHIEAHIYASRLAGFNVYPHLALIVSGGHTCLYKVSDPRTFEILGQTTDDAAGEAFDKVAKLLQLGFPGGPALSKCAESGNPDAIPFPRCGPNEKPGDTLNFSFSGLKTSVYYHLNPQSNKKGPHIIAPKADIAASFQEAACEILVEKTLAASKQTGIQAVSVGGGVACNRRLKELFNIKAKGMAGVEIFFPPPNLCTDNAAMSAGLAYHYLKDGHSDSLDLEVDPTPKRVKKLKVES